MAYKSTKKGKNSRKNKYSTFGTIAFIIIVAIIVIYYYYSKPDDNGVNDPGEIIHTDVNLEVNGVQTRDLKVHFVDVGQGDSIIIESPDGTNIIIDAGDTDAESRAKLTSYIDTLGITTFDYAIATHSDADHIGGFPDVFKKCQINCAMRPYVKLGGDYASEFDEEFIAGAKNFKAVKTKTYYEYLNSIKNENNCSWCFFNLDTDIVINIYDEELNVGTPSQLILDFLTPTAKVADIAYETANDFSPIIKMSYQGVRLSKNFLFTGDATTTVEKELMNYAAYGDTLDVDVLKVGHHGSTTSSMKGFLTTVTPEFAVISCGEGNSYHHPHQAILDRLLDLSITLYRTDLQGTICMSVSSETGLMSTVIDHPASSGLYDGPTTMAIGYVNYL